MGNSSSKSRSESQTEWWVLTIWKTVKGFMRKAVAAIKGQKGHTPAPAGGTFSSIDTASGTPEPLSAPSFEPGNDIVQVIGSTETSQGPASLLEETGSTIGLGPVEDVSQDPIPPPDSVREPSGGTDEVSRTSSCSGPIVDPAFGKTLSSKDSPVAEKDDMKSVKDDEVPTNLDSSTSLHGGLQADGQNPEKDYTSVLQHAMEDHKKDVQDDSEDFKVNWIESMLAKALARFNVLEHIEYEDEDESTSPTISPAEVNTHQDKVKVSVQSTIRTRGHTGPKEPRHKPTTEEELLRAMRSAQQTIARSNDPQQTKPASREDENAAALVVRSSLNVALPTYQRRGKSKKSVHPTLIYQPRNLSYEAEVPTSNYADTDIDFPDSQTAPTSQAITPDPRTSDVVGPDMQQNTTNPPALPHTLQEAVTKKQSNYLSWDQKLYTNLRLDKDSIRLIEIEPAESGKIEVTLVKEKFENVKNKYEALSYIWGDPEPKKMILVNGVEVPINTWLKIALKSLRLKDGRRTLWVDAICFNQADLVEKSRELPKMGDIYRYAKKVVIFHGRPSRSTGAGSLITALFKFLVRSDGKAEEPTSVTTKANSDVDQFQGFDKATVCKGFIDFCCRPWWRRLWTIQEFYLAVDEPTWYWGDIGASNVSLKRDIKLLTSASQEFYAGTQVEKWIPGKVEQSTEKPLVQFGAEILRITELINRRLILNGFDVPSRLYRSLSAKATDPHDMVYGLREIFGPIFRRVFVPDYEMPIELLYACLAVYLIQFERWSDMLWWYPYRFDSKELPSWLPDFRRRVTVDDMEPLPRDELLVGNSHISLAVVDHMLHAQGYTLDPVQERIFVAKGDGHDILRSLWNIEQFDYRMQPRLNYEPTDEERGDVQFNAFLQVCAASVWQNQADDFGRELPIFGWTAQWKAGKRIPSKVVETLPYWSVLLWSAFGEGKPPHALSSGQDFGNDRGGTLRSIFSPKITKVFEKTIGTDFISDCVFDWGRLEHVLSWLVNMSPWSKAWSQHWNTTDEDRVSTRIEFAKNRTSQIQSFLQSCAGSWTYGRDSFYKFHDLCALIINSSSCHSSFVQIIDSLKAAGADLNKLAQKWKINAKPIKNASDNATLEAQYLRYDMIASHYSGRHFFRTKRGFLGLASPGVELQGGETVLVLDNLSFPVVARNFKQDVSKAQLVGCAVVRGIDLRNSNAHGGRTPDGLFLGGKQLFQFL